MPIEDHFLIATSRHIQPQLSNIFTASHICLILSGKFADRAAARRGPKAFGMVRAKAKNLQEGVGNRPTFRMPRSHQGNVPTEADGGPDARSLSGIAGNSESDP